jgi:hypothetical protein
MRGNVVTAAAVFGAALVVSSLLLVLGLRWVVGGAADRLDAAVQAHGRSVERAGDAAGAPIRGGLNDMGKQMADAFDRHGQALGPAIEHAGDKISHPQLPDNYNVRLQGPVTVQGSVGLPQPLTVRGPADDGALPVNAKIGK